MAGSSIFLVKELKIESKISKCSYRKVETCFLEEDCDAPLFIAAAHKAGYIIKTKEFDREDESPIRNYQSFYTS